MQRSTKNKKKESFLYFQWSKGFAREDYTVDLSQKEKVHRSASQNGHILMSESD